MQIPSIPDLFSPFFVSFFCFLFFLPSFLASGIAKQEEVRIGLSAPFTGRSAQYGKQFRDGVELAIQMVNERGGILGRKLVLFLGDDAGDPKQGMAVANRLIGDRVQFVIGPFDSSVVIPASALYHEHEILVFVPTASNKEITERGLWNVFRTCGRDDQQVAAAAAYIVKFLGKKKIAFLHDKSAFGKGNAEILRKRLQESGKMKEVFYGGINVGEKDFSSVLATLAAKKAELVYFGGAYVEAALFLQQGREMGSSFLFFGGDTLGSQDFVRLGKEAIQGSYVTHLPDPRHRPEAARMVQRFLEIKKYPPEIFSLYAYAAVEVLSQAIVAASSFHPQEIARKIHSGIPFHTVIGEIAYNSRGDVQNMQYLLHRWEKDSKGRMQFRVLP